MLSPVTHSKIKTYPRALFPDSYCAQAGPSEGASRGVVKRDRLAVAAHGCNTHTQRHCHFRAIRKYASFALSPFSRYFACTIAVASTSMIISGNASAATPIRVLVGKATSPQVSPTHLPSVSR